MTRFAGFCLPHDSGLIAVQVVMETPAGWRGSGGHLSSNQMYAEYDAAHIANKQMHDGDTYEWHGLFTKQGEMDAFAAAHPPAPEAESIA